MNSVFSLLASLSLDDSSFEEGLNNAGNTASSFGSTISSALGTAGRVAGASILAVGTGVVAVGRQLANGITSVAEYGDEIDKMSQKLGISAEAYQEWDFIAQHAGTTVAGLQTSMKTLSNAVVDGSDAFEQLGISLEDAQAMSTEDLFSAVITGLQDMEEGTERTALASDLLGRSATELGALLNMTSEETEEMRHQVHDLGGVLSDEAVSSSANYADSLQNLQTAFSGLTNGMFAEFLPSIVSVMDGLTQIVGGDDSGLNLISQGVDDFVNKMFDKLPRVVDFAMQLLQTLATAIIQNLPALMNCATTLVFQLVDMLLSNLPQLIEVALQVIVTLAEGIIEALPDLIPAIVDIVIQIVETLIDNLDLLVEASIELIIALAEGIFNALPRLIERIPELVTKIMQAIVNNAPLIVNGAYQLVITLLNGIINYWRSIINMIPQLVTRIASTISSNASRLVSSANQLVTSLVNGIRRYWDWLLQWVSYLAGRVVSGFTNAFSAMFNVGYNIVTGIWNGICNGWSWLTQQVTNLANSLVQSVRNTLGIHSPSKVFATIGGFMAEGLGEGWEDEIGDVKKDINDSLNFSAQIPTSSAMANESSSAFESMLAKLDESISGIANMKIVMDTGATVGQLAPSMDKALGQRLAYAGRGV